MINLLRELFKGINSSDGLESIMCMMILSILIPICMFVIGCLYELIIFII